MRPIFIFDLDGTLALNEHRQHLVRGDNKDWPAFFAACDKDEPNLPVIATLDHLRRCGGEIWIWSGRSEDVRDMTLDWLMDNRVIDNRGYRFWPREPNRFRMRPAGDCSPDVELKRNWLRRLAPCERRRIIAVFDDRNSVVRMWREAGLCCYQVAEGDF